jgi:drug/metabolite transporter (DMT)-like permease
MPLHSSEWLGVVFFGTLQTIVYYFAYKAFEKGQVSILSPIFASFAGLVAIFSVIFFKETLGIGLIFALVLIFAGVLLMNLDLKSINTWHLQLRGIPGLKEILIATLLATFWTLGWDKFTKDQDWLLYTTLMFVFMTISAFFLALLNKVEVFKHQTGVWKFLWLIAVGEVVAYLAITIGYSSTNFTSIVAILSGASSLPTIVLARIFLKEKMLPLQIVASATIIMGIMLLSIR